MAFFQPHYGVKCVGAAIFWVKIIAEKRGSSGKKKMLCVFILVQWSIIENAV